MRKGWRTAPLQSLCNDFQQDIVDGPFGSELQRKDYLTEGFPVLKIQNVRPFGILLKKMDYVSAEKFAELRRHSFQRGDIVMTKLGSPLGVSAVVEDVEDGVIVADLVRIRAQRIDTRYLCYHLNSEMTSAFINSMQKGTTRPRVTLSVVRQLPIAVPSSDEQRRIVAILDEAFEAIATAKANAEKSLHNARELLTVATRQAFDALGERCEARLLGSVCRFENGDRGKNYPGKEHRVAQGIPFINAGHLTPTGIDFAEMDYISPERFALLVNGKVQPMDVLFCLRGSLGKYASVGDLSCGAIASSLVILRPTEELNHEYLLCFLGSTLCTEQIEAFKGGAAQPNLGAKDLKQFAIPLPPIDEQRLTAARILELQDRTSDLLKVTTQKLAALEELKKSLLHQAFSGQL